MQVLHDQKLKVVKEELMPCCVICEVAAMQYRMHIQKSTGDRITMGVCGTCRLYFYGDLSVIESHIK